MDFLNIIAIICIPMAGYVLAFPPASLEHRDDDQESISSYHFEYAVNDPITGDVKKHNEINDGYGTVKGMYSMMESDGSMRVVEYTADDVHGFRAQVKKIEQPNYKTYPKTEIPEDVSYKLVSAQHQKPIIEEQEYQPEELSSSSSLH
ncbi:pupal cuticle protein Edg-84A-like [Daktulosphaira vitifoliae]|uniref:pupal cuticle protein Edg-84A-like n=1 Tax=Daktulosphaira vitifoliae TaxID=58002 RepID=UPI0021AA30B2|nr:pupal cuticle protein Edg-84A-like [Daktulosphaira vitifoliae]